MRKLIFILLSLLAVISLTACSDSSSSDDSSNVPPPQTSHKGVTPLNFAPVVSSFSGADNIDIIYRVELEHDGYSYYLVDKNGIITNKLSNNLVDYIDNMYNIIVAPEYISDAVNPNSVVIAIPSTRFTQVGDAQNEENIPYGTKITAIDSNIEVIEGITKLADISGTKPSVDLLTYAEMTQGYFSGCSEETNVCSSEFTRYPDSSAVVITPAGNTKYENGVISSDTDTINLSVELTARPEERADGYTYLGGSIITQTTATLVSVDGNSISCKIEKITPEMAIKDMLRVQLVNDKALNAYTTPAITTNEWKYDVTILNLLNEGVNISSDNTNNSYVSFFLNLYGNGDSALSLNMLPIQIAGSTENYAVCNNFDVENIGLELDEKSKKTILPLTINANGLERALQEQIVYNMTGITTEEQIKCIDVQFQMYKASPANTEHPFYEGKIATNNTKSNYYVMLDPAKSKDRFSFVNDDEPEITVQIRNVVNNDIKYFTTTVMGEPLVADFVVGPSFINLFNWGEVEDETTAEEGALSDRFYLLFVNKDTINTIGTPVAIDNGKFILDEYRETTLSEIEQFLKDNLGSSLAFKPKGAYIELPLSTEFVTTPDTFEIDVDGIQKVTAVNIMSDGYEKSDQYNKGLFGSLKKYDAEGTPVFSTGFGFKITTLADAGNEPDRAIVPHLNDILAPQIVDIIY